jgi:hypothetical protein
MNPSQLLRQALPHLVAVILYVVVSLLFFGPVSFDNKVLYQHDILQSAGGNQEIIEFRERTGEEPLWTNSMFGGMPAYLLTVEYAGDWVTTLLQVNYLGLPHPPKLVFVAMLSFYILLLCAGVRPWLAIAGGLAYGLSTFLLISIEAGHNAKVLAMANMPMVVGGVLLAYRNKLVWGFILTALGLALHLRAGHLQITYYLFLILLILGIVWLVGAIKAGQLPLFLKQTGLLAVAALLAVGCNWGRIYNTYKYSQYSIRGGAELSSQADAGEEGSGLSRDYAFAWSSGKAESLTLLIPYFYGGASGETVASDSELAKTLRGQGVPEAQVREFIQRVPTYFGNQAFTAGPIYVGAVICFLFALGLLLAPNEYRIWLLAATLLSLLLSWGKNLEWFNYFLFDYLPGYNKFRAVTMALSIALLTIPLLGFIGLEFLIRRLQATAPAEKPLPGTAKAAAARPLPLRNAILIAAGVTGGIALLVALFAGMSSYSAPVDQQLGGYPDWLLQAIRKQRESMVRGDAFRTLIFVLLSAGVVYALWLRKLGVLAGAALLGLLVLADLWMVDARYLDDSKYSRDPRRQYFAATAADQTVLADTDPHYRVLNLLNPFNEARTSYHHRSVGGYHGAKLRRYQDLIAHAMEPEINQLIGGLQAGNPNFEEARVLNMLDTRYLLAGQQREAVIQNPAAMGPAWLVEGVQAAQSPDEEMVYLKQIDPRRTAVINTQRYPLQQQSYTAEGSISLAQYELNHIIYQAETSGNALAVFSEIYYPDGWVATINGQPAPILQANYVLRALELPAGSSTIEFRFEPKSYSSGNVVMLICNILLFALFIGALIWEFRRRRAQGSSSDSRA